MLESITSKNINNLKSLYSSKSSEDVFQNSEILLLFQNKSSLFKGKFYFADFPSEYREFWIVLNFDSMNYIYNTGRDSVGPYVCIGKKYSENSAVFTQKYFDDYEISYECFYCSNDSIEGNWKTTNAKGHFILKRDLNFDFDNFIIESLEDIIILLRNPTDQSQLLNNMKTFNQELLLEVEYFKPFFDNSILSVMINGSQGGIPTKKIEKEFEGLEELFNQYKNINLLSDTSLNNSQSEHNTHDSFEESDIQEYSSNLSESIVLNQTKSKKDKLN